MAKVTLGKTEKETRKINEEQVKVLKEEMDIEFDAASDFLDMYRDANDMGSFYKDVFEMCGERLVEVPRRGKGLKQIGTGPRQGNTD